MSFDSYAKNWDTDMRINRASIVAKEISNTVDKGHNATAMEYGCGTGLVSFNLPNRFKHITMIDSSRGGMVDIAKDKIANYKSNNMSANCLDIADDMKIDDKYDIIYNSMVLHHIPNTKDITKEFHTLLNDKGILCIVDLDEEDGTFHKKNTQNSMATMDLIRWNSKSFCKGG